MSEYQYYAFVAIDRPLDAQAQAEVGALSTRAEITATRFVNEYHWGDFRGDPNQLMERYYDAHLYFANWGTRRIMLRLPRNLLDLDVAGQYCVSDQVTAWTAGQHLVLSLTNDDESGDWDYEPQASLSSVIGIRDELAAGDHRALYLAWLADYGVWEPDEDAFDHDEDDELEPPVPPGLRTLTAPQHELAEFLRVDEDLLAVAAEASPPFDVPADDPERLAAWLTRLPTDETAHRREGPATAAGRPGTRCDCTNGDTARIPRHHGAVCPCTRPPHGGRTPGQRLAQARRTAAPGSRATC